MTIHVIIPTYCPDEKFEKTLEMLKKQTVQPDKILIINTEESLFQSRMIHELPQAELMHIPKSAFDHGGTRNLAASRCDCDIMILFTQDAVLANEYVIERLTAPFADAEVCAAYGRQLADRRDNPVEAYTRIFNYPKQSSVKSMADLERLGIKTFFLSDVCSAYRKSYFDAMGGFPENTIFGEDTMFAAKLILDGKKIAYAADARVWHWHNYTAKQQLKRNFDVAVGQQVAGGVFVSVKSESEGIRLVLSTLKYFIKRGRFLLIPHILVQNGAKYIGYKLGQNYQKLPRKWVLALTSNPSWWKDR